MKLTTLLQPLQDLFTVNGYSWLRLNKLKNYNKILTLILITAGSMVMWHLYETGGETHNRSIYR